MEGQQAHHGVLHVLEGRVGVELREVPHVLLNLLCLPLLHIQLLLRERRQGIDLLLLLLLLLGRHARLLKNANKLLWLLQRHGAARSHSSVCACFLLL